jgi:hypothetical protein
VKKFCTVKEAALRIGKTEQTVWLAIYRNQFPHRRWGKRVLIPIDDLETFPDSLPGVSATQAQAACDSVVAVR